MPAGLRGFACIALTPLVLALPVPAFGWPFAYVSNQASATVSVIDIATNAVVATMPSGGGNPWPVAVNPVLPRVYVNNISGTTSVFDTTTNTQVATIGGGFSGMGLAVNPSGTRVYRTAGILSVIDTASNSVIATIAVGLNPRGVVVNPAGTLAFVTHSEILALGSASLYIVDTATNTVVSSFPIGAGPQANGVDVNPSGTRVYVAHTSANAVEVIDPFASAVVGTIPVGANPIGIAVNPAGTRAYTSNSGSNTVSVIDLAANAVIATVPVGVEPFGIAVNPAGTAIYVVNRGSNTVSVIDAASNVVTTTIAVGNFPNGFGKFIGSGRLFTGPSPAVPGVIAASFSGGGATCIFSSVQFVPLAPAAAPPANSPLNPVVFPYGGFQFTTTGCAPGSTLTFTLTYPTPLRPGALFYVFGPTPSDPNPHWYIMPATIAGNSIVFSITDGGLGDSDLAVNGSVSALAAAGLAADNVPTLDEWARIALVLLLLAAGGTALKRARLEI